VQNTCNPSSSLSNNFKYKKDTNPENEMMGHGGLSKCYMKLKKMDLALEHLNKYYSLSKGANNY